MENIKIITETTPLQDKDCIYLVEKNIETLEFPIHKHNVLELTFIENAKGAKRYVGNSIEQIQNAELVLFGINIEHGWEHYACESTEVNVITIQFPADIINPAICKKNAAANLGTLMESAANGVAFVPSTAERYKPRLEEIAAIDDEFHRLLKLYEVLHDLSNETNYRKLSTGSFTCQTENINDIKRVGIIKKYIEKNYKKEIRLTTLSKMVEMTPTSLSRFFKSRTGKSTSEYIIDLRLKHAARKLANSTMSVLDICFECGFTNLSNFNRSFKKKKGCTPSSYRDIYHTIEKKEDTDEE